MAIIDSGERKQFENGAVRDIEEGKGRFDLIPLKTIFKYTELLYKVEDTDDYESLSNILNMIINFRNSGNTDFLITSIYYFVNYLRDHDENYEGHENTYRNPYIIMISELAKHFEEGAKKYGERNWERGIPLHSYMNSALRHLFKYFDGWKDERHDRAFVWNIVCACWTYNERPDLDDYTCPCLKKIDYETGLVKENEQNGN